MLLIAERMHVLWGLIEKESVFFFFLIGERRSLTAVLTNS